MSIFSSRIYLLTDVVSGGLSFMLDVQVVILYSMSVFEGKYGRIWRISLSRVVFVCVEGIDFDGRRVFFEWKWLFSSGSWVVLRGGVSHQARP